MFCRRRTLLVSWFLFLLGVAAAPAADSVLIRTNYYVVTGSTPREIADSMTQARPWKDRMASDANTRWKVSWSYEFSRSDGGCRLRSLGTKTEITITLPKWSGSKDAAPELVGRWNKYAHALAQHENGHRLFALATAPEIRRRVEALESKESCDEFAAAINATANKTLAEFGQREADYDKQTEHGGKQGARFP